MKLQKVFPKDKYIYHYTTRQHAQQILNEGIVRCRHDNFTFFTASYRDAVRVCHGVLRKGSPYIANDLTLKYRENTDFSDYVILKLQYQTHEDFYQLITKHPQNTFSAYDYALMHPGNLQFKAGKILPLKAQPLSVVRHTVTKAAIAGGTCLLLSTLLSMPAYAARDTWMTVGNYDTSWYDNSNTNSYELYDVADLAGLSYLANNGTSFTGKYININNDIDLSTKEWTSIPMSMNR